MATQVMTSMEKAKAIMCLRYIFFASLVLSTDIIEDPEGKHGKTACTDMVRIWYYTPFIESLEADVVMFVLAHEAMHIALKHGLRRGSRGPIRWNIACDFAINWMLKEAGFKIWEHACCDSKYAGMSAEQIYDIREEEAAERKRKGKGTPNERGKGSPGQGYSDNGSDDLGGLGEDIIPPENLGAEDLAEIERCIEQNVARATAQAKMAGQLPGCIERLVDGILHPPLTWQELLRDYMVKKVADEESWSRRNKRNQAIYLPTRHSEAMGELLMIGDTSGSIGDEMFSQIGAEIAEIREYVKPERVRMIWADDEECSSEQVWEPDEDMELKPVGGGGTDMRKPLAWIEQYDPVVAVLITDGLTPWSSDPTPYPLIILCNTMAECPTWAAVIRIRTGV